MDVTRDLEIWGIGLMNPQSIFPDGPLPLRAPAPAEFRGGFVRGCTNRIPSPYPLLSPNLPAVKSLPAMLGVVAAR